MKKLYFICLIMIVHVEYLTAQEDHLTKTFALPSNNYKVNDTSTIEPLTKPVKVVSIIDQKSETFKRELEVWNAFLGSVDLQNIGFIFLVRPLVDLDRFKKHWFEEMQMNYPFFYDQSNKIFVTNSISEAKPGHTMVLDKNNEVIEEGGKVINTDPFNLYRSTLHNLTTEMGIKKSG
ncbi:hypothetical protein [Cyclobacterium qasimii]|uniref:Uncharacterized protein n=1 Tax=Cyclobacterium qasimii M12-11B TaxID=641524 RepID=S7WZJ1_9BACT|nr:hypothetical protein [Cyclobacterium qasimii]EPR69313.1 hypothetical protein ADICYQ_1660 [Cyclobacterium qasimii M12-11B]